MNIFEQYGIREIANATIYTANRDKNNDELYYIPLLYFDTLKICSVEQTSNSKWSSGGIENGRLVNWDDSKNINISIQDALFSPSSLSLCYNGMLSVGWIDNQIDFQFSIKKIDRFEKVEKYHYLRPDGRKNPISTLLPQAIDDKEKNGLVVKSSIVDELKIYGSGNNGNHIFNWKLKINSCSKSIAQIPDRFYDSYGKMYLIDQDVFSVFNLSAPTYCNYKDAFIYRMKQNKGGGDNVGDSLVNQVGFDHYGSVEEVNEELDTCAADYIAIIIDQFDNYKVLVGKKDENNFMIWYKPKNEIDTNIFKKMDLWIKFNNLNELIYYLITKYSNYINEIKDNAIWVYINPKTMKPFEDTYWFAQGESYLLKRLVISNNLKGNSLIIKSRTVPKMCMLKGETYIKDKDGKESKVQIQIPYCKINLNQTLQLNTEGEPCVFDFVIEAAPKNGKTAELTFYESQEFKIDNENIDNSTIIMSE